MRPLNPPLQLRNSTGPRAAVHSNTSINPSIQLTWLHSQGIQKNYLSCIQHSFTFNRQIKFEKLIQVFITSELDYCSSLYFQVPPSFLSLSLQSKWVSPIKGTVSVAGALHNHTDLLRPPPIVALYSMCFSHTIFSVGCGIHLSFWRGL